MVRSGVSGRRGARASGSPVDELKRQVRFLVELAAETRDEASLVEALMRTGIPWNQARRTVSITECAFGLYFAEPAGARLAPQATVADQPGRVLILSSSPEHVAAMSLIPEVVSEPGFAVLLRLSAELGALGRAVEAGERPGDVVIATCFTELPEP